MVNGWLTGINAFRRPVLPCSMVTWAGMQTARLLSFISFSLMVYTCCLPAAMLYSWPACFFCCCPAGWDIVMENFPRLHNEPEGWRLKGASLLLCKISVTFIQNVNPPRSALGSDKEPLGLFAECEEVRVLLWVRFIMNDRRFELMLLRWTNSL